MNDMTVRTEAKFSVTSEDLWTLLTKSEYTKRYMFGCGLFSNWTKGSELLWKDSNEKVLVKGAITEIEYPKKLYYTTFDPNIGLKDSPENYMLVTYDIEPDNNGCVLKVTQGDFSGTENSKKRFEECKQGWQYVFEGIKKLLNE